MNRSEWNRGYSKPEPTWELSCHACKTIEIRNGFKPEVLDEWWCNPCTKRSRVSFILRHPESNMIKTMVKEGAENKHVISAVKNKTNGNYWIDEKHMSAYREWLREGDVKAKAAKQVPNHTCDSSYCCPK